MRIVFLGPPGAGKGTQAQRLKDYLDIAHLSTGDMLRDADEAGTRLGREAARYMNAGKLVPDDVVVGIVVERLAEQDCCRRLPVRRLSRAPSPQAEALDRDAGRTRHAARPGAGTGSAGGTVWSSGWPAAAGRTTTATPSASGFGSTLG